MGQECTHQDQTNIVPRRCLGSISHWSHLTTCRGVLRKSSALSCLARPPNVRSLGSRQVWERWRLAPPAYEFCVQRLRWYQSIAREPAKHAHILCCWFGRVHFESHDTLIDGLRLHPEANEYAKRLLADLQALALVQSGQSRRPTSNWIWGTYSERAAIGTSGSLVWI